MDTFYTFDVILSKASRNNIVHSLQALQISLFTLCIASTLFYIYSALRMSDYDNVQHVFPRRQQVDGIMRNTGLTSCS